MLQPTAAAVAAWPRCQAFGGDVWLAGCRCRHSISRPPKCSFRSRQWRSSTTYHVVGMALYGTSPREDGVIQADVDGPIMPGPTYLLSLLPCYCYYYVKPAEGDGRMEDVPGNATEAAAAANATENTVLAKKVLLGNIDFLKAIDRRRARNAGPLKSRHARARRTGRRRSSWCARSRRCRPTWRWVWASPPRSPSSSCLGWWPTAPRSARGGPPAWP